MIFCACVSARYRVDLQKRQQINTVTGYTRDVRRVSNSTKRKKLSKAKAKTKAILWHQERSTYLDGGISIGQASVSGTPCILASLHPCIN